MKKAWMDIPFRLLIEASQMHRYSMKLISCQSGADVAMT